MSSCDFKCFLVWIRLCVALSVLRSVRCNVIQYCLCVSGIQCTQCSVSSQSIASAQFNPSSVQSHHQFSFLSVQSILRVESVAYIVNGVQC